MELQAILQDIQKQAEQLSWEGSFEEYFQMAIHHPEITRLSHARIYDAIQRAGTKTNRLGQRQYALFSGELFGLEKTITQVVEYFHASAERLDTRKRILLLMGPPASGKSTLANLIKKGLENYSRTEPGALYAIKGCPMQEEPLHLIPLEYRPELLEKYGLYIEGELCPHCRWMLGEVYQGKIDQVKVRRVVLNESKGVGIGTFVATDPGSQELSRLTGSLEISAASEDRLESFGKNYRLNGELNVANRGLMEFIEIFKMDERFLAVLLELTESQKIKAPGYGTIYADEAILAHSNETEYEAMRTNPKTEGLQDRMVVVSVPYNLRVHDETRIYEKLLASVDLKGVHIAPLTLPVVSIFAVLSRLQPPERSGISLVQKMRLYDGQYVKGYTDQDASQMQEMAFREGMAGISPRFIINQISRAVSRSGVTCLDPLDLLETIWGGLEQSTSLSHEERGRLQRLFEQTRREYDQMARRELQKACVDHFEQKANQMANRYLEEVAHFLADQNGHNGHNQYPTEPQERFMRSIERQIDVQDYDLKAFRQDIYRRMQSILEANQRIGYTDDSRLEEAILNQLCPSERELTAILEPEKKLTEERRSKREEVRARLIGEHDYNQESAGRLMSYVAESLDLGERSGLHLPRALQWLQG